MTVENDDLQSLINAKWLSGFENDKLEDLKKFINDLDDNKISPEKDKIFNAFKIGNNGNICEPKDVKVLIIGQDPYTKISGKADGYAFSQNGKKPAEDSLLNIYIAIQKAYKFKNKDIDTWDTNLATWAKDNGVLLLNTALTYQKGKKIEHQNNWKNFIELVINKLLTTVNNKLVVFLWGDDARRLFHKVMFESDNIRDILVLPTSHPSKNYDAYKKGFCYEAPNHFKACDEFLKEPVWENLWKYIN